MASVISFLVMHKVLLLSVALGISELMALIPSLQSNGILAAIINFLKGQGAVDPAGK